MKIEISERPPHRPQHGVDATASLFIAAGKVAAIGRRPRAGSANRVIDATGLVVCPGLIDLSARLREPGFEYKATLESEMNAAIAGGVTSLACPPDTDPPLDEPGPRRDAQASRALAQPGARLSGRRAHRGLRGRDAHRDGRARRSGLRRVLACRRAARRTRRCCCARCSTRRRSAIAVWLRPQDAYLARGGVAHDGEVATRLGLRGDSCRGGNDRAGDDPRARARDRRARAPRAACRRADGVAHRARRQEGTACRVTCDVAMHHLHLCDVDIGWFDAQCRLVPPLRGTRDRAALRAGLADGTIDASAPTTRRSTTTRSSCRSPKPSPARPASSCCCRSRSNGRAPKTLRCPRRSRASPRIRLRFSASTPGILPSAARRMSASSIRLRSGRSIRRR